MYNPEGKGVRGWKNVLEFYEPELVIENVVAKGRPRFRGVTRSDVESINLMQTLVVSAVQKRVTTSLVSVL